MREAVSADIVEEAMAESTLMLLAHMPEMPERRSVIASYVFLWRKLGFADVPAWLDADAWMNSDIGVFTELLRNRLARAAERPPG